MANEQQCPFCPSQLPDDPQMWQKVGGAFFNGKANVGNIPSCDECALYAWMADATQMMINALHRARQAQATEAK